MDDFCKLCRTYTTLTAVQQEFLKRLLVIFPFLADLAHARVRLYLQTKDRKAFVIAAQEWPRTIYLPPDGTAEGRVVRAMEEPILCHAVESHHFLRGKREWNYGSMVDMMVQPLIDGTGLLGLVCFETTSEMAESDGYDRLLSTARLLLRNPRRQLNPEMFAPMSASDGILLTDQYNRITYATTAALRIFRVLGVGSLRGGHLFDRQMTQHVTRETVETDRPWQKEITAGGLILIRREIVVREGGNLCMRIVIISDVTETRAKDKEIRIKSAVIQEIHHRVKNNLQAIASLLRIQARRAKTAEVKAALKESVNRILSISVVHEYLSQQGSEDIDVQEVMGHIFDLAARNMTDRDFLIRTEFKGPRLILPSKCASSVALVLNELVLNAMEHAFTGRTSGLIGLVVQEDADHWHLDFYDDGVGLPEGFEDMPRKSLGLTLVEGDLGGTFAIENDERGPGHGTHARLCIPKVQPNPTDEG